MSCKAAYSAARVVVRGLMWRRVSVWNSSRPPGVRGAGRCADVEIFKIKDIDFPGPACRVSHRRALAPRDRGPAGCAKRSRRTTGQRYRYAITEPMVAPATARARSAPQRPGPALPHQTHRRRCRCSSQPSWSPVRPPQQSFESSPPRCKATATCVSSRRPPRNLRS